MQASSSPKFVTYQQKAGKDYPIQCQGQLKQYILGIIFMEEEFGGPFPLIFPLVFSTQPPFTLVHRSLQILILCSFSAGVPLPLPQILCNTPPSASEGGSVKDACICNWAFLINDWGSPLA